MLSFAAGETSKSVRVAVVDDTLAEASETVIAAISNASTGSIATTNATASIIASDQSVWGVTAAIASVDEGSGYVAYTISRTGGTAAATLSFATAGGTAIAGSDYTAVNQSLSFAVGELSKTVLVAINNDTLAESNETVVGVISDVSTGSIAAPTATATINDNDQSIWSVAAATASVDEGAGYITYTVSRTGATGAATLNFGTAGGTANAGSDYTAANQVLSFAAGEVQKIVRVAIANDTLAEANETVIGVIGSVSSGQIATSTATATIVDNDAARSTFAITAVAANVSEGAGAAVYSVARTGDLSSSQSIDYYMAGGTATAGADYTAVSGTLTFAAGESIKLIAVPLIDDAIVDAAETLIVGLGNASAGSITTSTATITLTDDDAPATGTVSYAVAVSSNNVYESAGVGAFTITRSGDTTISSTSYFRTNGGTATAGTDYTGVTSQTLTWGAGETTKVVTVLLTNDVLVEATETIIGQIASDAAFTVSASTATLNVLDDDTPASGTNTYTIAASSEFESSGLAAFTVTRAGDLTQASTSYFRTNGGTATTGVDYTAIASQTLSWAVGESTKVVWVNLTNDSLAEGSESVTGQSATDAAFTLGLASASSAVLDDDMYTATAGVADTLVMGTANGAYLGGGLIDTGDLADSVTVVGATSWTQLSLGTGNDTLSAATSANLLVAGARFNGGAGVDTLALSGNAQTYNIAGLSNTSTMFAGFEIISLSAVNNQTLNLSLQDVLEMSSGNAVANTLRITSNGGDVLNLQAFGKTLTTPTAASSITDVDGTTYSVISSTAGNALTNDVSIGGVTYDVYQYSHSGQLLNLLVATNMTTNIV